MAMAPRKRKQSVSSREHSSDHRNKDDINLESSSLTKLEKSLGFNIEDLSSFERFCRLMFRPKNPSSLAVVRILFGLLMMVDTLEERGLSEADFKWGDPHSCHFPLFNFLRPLTLEWMCLLYLIMWLGAAGLMLGAFFRVSCLCFILPYWYIFLLDKSAWNNHSYLYGLLSTMFLFSSAHHCWSVDALLGRVPSNSHVPLWNYAVLRFQVFVLYFIAGLKKLDQDWLNGYSMSNLASHWLFDPFKLLMSQEQIDYWIVHFFGFFLDLTIGFWMYFDKTRPVALVFLGSFHIMNSRIFSIGMFPYVCLATMPLFCHTDWPRKLIAVFNMNASNANPTVSSNASNANPTVSSSCIYAPKSETKQQRENEVKWDHKLTCSLLLCHVFLQGFLPYSHFITEGYNNWTNGLYGYSWDMMVHTWDTILIVVKVVDKDTGEEHFLDPQAWTHTDRYSKHGDMMHQYAHCLQDNIRREYPTIQNMSVHIDVWSSLNRRFQQRMFDPRVDLLTVDWSPFRPVPWLMPLLTGLSPWRRRMAELEEQVYSWSNYTDVLFVADFPGLQLENYINEDLTNVSLTVLEGEVVVELEGGFNTTVYPGDYVNIPTMTFHMVNTVSPTPSCYMYVYTNQTLFSSESNRDQQNMEKRRKFALLDEIGHRWNNLKKAANLVSHALLKILYSVPMLKRIKML